MLFYRYAQYGDVSPKVDVYAFGVVLYELISAKEAIVKPNGSLTESKGLVALVNFFTLLIERIIRLLFIPFISLLLQFDRQFKTCNS